MGAPSSLPRMGWGRQSEAPLSNAEGLGPGLASVPSVKEHLLGAPLLSPRLDRRFRLQLTPHSSLNKVPSECGMGSSPGPLGMDPGSMWDPGQAVQNSMCPSYLVIKIGNIKPSLRMLVRLNCKRAWTEISSVPGLGGHQSVNLDDGHSAVSLNG